MAVVRHKEAIHSGHFMISNFEAEAQDDEENIAVPVPEEGSNADITNDIMTEEEIVQNHFQPLVKFLNSSNMYTDSNNLIDASLNKLFKCMSIAYRQKLTSPKWNRFRGMKLRWKDKIRLNNVIWRCWHMQFIKGHRKLVCAFANPLEIDNHNKTEAGAILEGKYWKRKLATVTAEYKRWRIFYKQQHETCATTTTPHHQFTNDHFMDVTNTLYQYGTKDDADLEAMITDADFFVDALFNSLGSHSKTHDTSDLSGTELLPSNCQFQANIEELMDLDPLAPLQDWLTSKMPEVDVDNGLRGKSLTPDQDGLSLPLPDVKDIDVFGDSYSPQQSTSSYRDTRHRSFSLSSSSSTPVLVINPNKIQTKGVPSKGKVINLHQRKGNEGNCKPVNNRFKRGKLWSAAVKQHEEEQQKREKEKLESQQENQQFALQQEQLLQQQQPQMQQITNSTQHQMQQQQQLANHKILTSNPYENQEELMLRHQVGSDMLLKQLTDHQQPHHYHQGHKQQKQLQLELKSLPGVNMLIKDQEYQPCTVKLEDIDRQSVKHSVIQPPQNLQPLQDMRSTENLQLSQNLQPLQNVVEPHPNQQLPLGGNSFKASEYLRRPDPFEEKFAKFDGFYSLQTEEIPDLKMIEKNRRVSAPGGGYSGAPGGGHPGAPGGGHPGAPGGGHPGAPGGGHPGASGVGHPSQFIIQGEQSMQGGRLRPRNLESLQENEVYNATGQDEGEQGSTGVTYYTTTGEEVSTPMDEEINETPLNPDKIEESQLLHLLKENRQRQMINTETKPLEIARKNQPTAVVSSRGGRGGRRGGGQQLSRGSVVLQAASPEYPDIGSGSSISGIGEFYPNSNNSSHHQVHSVPQPQPCFTIGSSTPNPGLADDKLSLAECKRKNTIKNGFDFLKALVPSLAQNPNAKISKAALLIKGGEYIKQLKDERDIISEEISQMKKTVELLTLDITGFQTTLASSGQPHPTNEQIGRSDLERLYTQHVSSSTMQNWKYWVFSRLMNPLLLSFDKTVSTSSCADMMRTSSSWLDQHVSQTQLRPMVMNTLKELCICTEILSEPHKMPQEALNAISEYNQKKNKDSRNSSNQKSSTELDNFQFKFG